MSGFKDHFSHNSCAYRNYRPGYPDELFAWLGNQCLQHNVAWDCGCGTGQSALMLVPYFKQVIATDPSSEQICNAIFDSAIDYRIMPAEQTDIKPKSIDLIVVAQALHWFDFERFYGEVRRVAADGCLLAAITYDLLRISEELDPVIDRFYHQIIGPFWPPERKHVDTLYKNIPFPFDEFATPDFVTQEQWNLHHLLGYLNTWSAVKEYRMQFETSPLDLIMDDLTAAWGDPEQVRLITWPVTVRLGRTG
jgi:SAM-dependent methyltransferase